MLIKCPECDLQVSDKAISCPHCGFPMSDKAKNIKVKSTKRKRRLPNGFGQISEIKGRNLRNPFRAMVTIGKNEFGKPICRPLKPEAYFPTYNDAYSALVEYNRNPYEPSSKLTVEELYEQWSKKYFKTVSDATVKAITVAWGYCSMLYKMQVGDIRTRHIKTCMEEGSIVVKGIKRKAKPSAQLRIKSLFNLLLDYAVEYEIISKNYARDFKIPDEVFKEKKSESKEHIAFTDEEINLLWDNLTRFSAADMVLIQCYSGWRPQELCLLKIEDVNINDWTFKGGVKTSAGIDRIVPIHEKIRALVQRRYNEALKIGSKYLFNDENETSITYNKYKFKFDSIRDALRMDKRHRPHDGRKHFVTMAKKYNVDEYAIKYIVGHTISDLTERVYTQRDIEWLKEEMKKIK